MVAGRLHRRQRRGRVLRVHEHRLAVVVAAHRLPRGCDQLRPVKGVGPYHALARFLGPHLVEDKISVRVGDQLAVIDLDPLVPVRMIADHYVGAPIDRCMSYRHRVVRCGHAGICEWLALVLLAPVELHDHDVGELPRAGDSSFERHLVDGHPNAVESDEPELQPADVDHCDRSQSRCLDAVLL